MKRGTHLQIVHQDAQHDYRAPTRLQALMRLGEHLADGNPVAAQWSPKRDVKRIVAVEASAPVALSALTEPHAQAAVELFGEEVRAEMPADAAAATPQRTITKIARARAERHRWRLADFDGATTPVPVCTPAAEHAVYCDVERLNSWPAAALRYVDEIGETSERVVNPLSWNGRVLVAYCHMRRGVRGFRADRIMKITRRSAAQFTLPDDVAHYKLLPESS